MLTVYLTKEPRCLWSEKILPNISSTFQELWSEFFFLREKEKRECKGQMGTNTYSSLSMWLGLPCNMAARSVSKSPKSQPGGDYKPFYDLVSGDMEGHDPHIVITGMDSLRPARIKGEGDQNPPFDKKNVQEFADCCNNHHGPTFNRMCLHSSHMKLPPSSPETLFYSKQFYLSLHQV